MDAELHAWMTAESPNALVALDAAGVVSAWSPAAERLFGQAARQAVGRTLDELVVPRGHAPLATLVARAAAGEAVQEERVCRRLDGTLACVLCTLRAGAPADANVRAAGAEHLPTVHAALADITPMRVQRDRQRVVTHYQALLELAPDAIVIVNDLGLIVLLNARGREMFGHEEAEVLGQPVEVLLPERLREVHVGHRNAFLSTPRMRGMGAGLVLAGRRRDGSEFPVEISLSPIPSDEGRLVMSAIRDTTERQRYERALQDKNAELERANRAKDQFLAAMSHELRTPLNAILGFTGLLLMQLPGPLNAAQQRQLSLVQSSGKHLLSLINDLLDLAKVESGRVELQLQPVECLPVLEAVAATLRPAAADKGLTLEVQAPSDPVWAQADPRALHQVVLNLAGNAVKFTNQGQVSLRLACRAQQVVLDIVDTGMGISEADQAQLFERFRQVGATSRKDQQGTGLGLHLSRSLAGLMHGHLRCTSTPGQGSCFSLELPAAEPGTAPA